MQTKSIVLLGMSVLLSACAFSAAYSGGTGEAESPYRIETAEDLNSIGADPNDWDKHFLLTADINLADYIGTQFNLIGYLEHWDDPGNRPFTGVFDGNGHTISNFEYNYVGEKDAIGLFRYVFSSDAEIRNLGLVDPNVDAARDCVGALVGWLRNGTVTNCYVRGGNISGSFATGGLVGDNWGKVSCCFTMTTTVLGQAYVGGLAGHNSGMILDCYAMGEVFGEDAVGGIVGMNWGNIADCYATACPWGALSSGGLVGVNGSHGSHFGTLNACFWDKEASGKPSGVGDGSSNGVTGKTTDEMMIESTFTDGGWDFIEIWNIGENQTYPYLRVYPAGDLNHDGRVDFFDITILASHWLEGTEH